MIGFQEFVELFDPIPGEPEFEFFFMNTDNAYMAMKYNDHS